MYYDDGYEIGEVRFIEKSELPEGYMRAYKLNNGDVFTIYDLLLEFEDNILYEVKAAKTWFNPYYERTGIIFTIEQINKMIETKELI